MLQEVLVHVFFDHHLLIELDQEVLSLFAAHMLDLGFKRTKAELLFQGEFDRLAHNTLQVELVNQVDRGLGEAEIFTERHSLKIVESESLRDCRSCLPQECSVVCSLPNLNTAYHLHITEDNNRLTKRPPPT